MKRYIAYNCDIMAIIAWGILTVSVLSVMRISALATNGAGS